MAANGNSAVGCMWILSCMNVSIISRAIKLGDPRENSKDFEYIVRDGVDELRTFLHEAQNAPPEPVVKVVGEERLLLAVVTFAPANVLASSPDLTLIVLPSTVTLIVWLGRAASTGCRRIRLVCHGQAVSSAFALKQPRRIGIDLAGVCSVFVLGAAKTSRI